MDNIYSCPLCGVKIDNPQNPEIPYGAGLTFCRSLMVCPDCQNLHKPEIEALLGPQWDAFISNIQKQNAQTIADNQTNAINEIIGTLQNKVTLIQSEAAKAQGKEVADNKID